MPWTHRPDGSAVGGQWGLGDRPWPSLSSALCPSRPWPSGGLPGGASQLQVPCLGVGDFSVTTDKNPRFPSSPCEARTAPPTPSALGLSFILKGQDVHRARGWMLGAPSSWAGGVSGLVLPPSARQTPSPRDRPRQAAQPGASGHCLRCPLSSACATAEERGQGWGQEVGRPLPGRTSRALLWACGGRRRMGARAGWH